jgi:hypothetical protein
MENDLNLEDELTNIGILAKCRLLTTSPTPNRGWSAWFATKETHS